MITCSNCRAQNRDNARFCGQCGVRLPPGSGISMVLGGEYRVVEVVKAGGMGTVYKAESGGYLYAVKEMRDAFTHPKERQDAINRFMAEALILARLSHPHIPAIHRHFIENERYYLVMDFIAGEDLQTVVDRQGGKGLPEEQVLGWALQICAVLEYLHGQSPPVIFRDLKPTNVMLRPDGDISLIDFGIARLFDPARQGTLIGTPGYAAPEQYQGLAEPRSDIFALGATLHHLLTGRDPQRHPPFVFPPVTAVNPAITAEMEAVIQKALQMNLEGRWASAREVRQVLVSLAGPIKLEPGVVLARRYQIAGKASEFGGGGQRPWHLVSFEAIDLQTGTKCWVIPMGADPVEDHFIRRLASLRHQALPRMEIVTHRGVVSFISSAVEGTPLDSFTIQRPSQLISIGFQLCDVLEATGSCGAGFSWGDLQVSHVLLNPEEQVMIDSYKYCHDWLHNRRLGASDDHNAKERVIPPFLSLLGFVKSHVHQLEQEDAEVAEVEIVGSAMAVPLVDGRPPFDLHSHPLGLRQGLLGVPVRLEQAILGALGAMPSDLMGMPWIRSLSWLRQHLLGWAEGPARATVSVQRVDFGSVSWGETLSVSVQLSSQSPWLLYGEIQCNEEGLRTIPSGFVKAHPCQIEIEISWNTRELETCGALDGEVLITTGVDSFRIAVRIDVQPNAEFHSAQARRHLDRQVWAAAVQHCNELVSLQPSDPRGYRLRGQAYHGLSQYANAVRDYTRAIQLNPNDPEYYWSRSLTYEALGQKRDAIKDLRQTISLEGRGSWMAKEAQQRIVELQRA